MMAIFKREVKSYFYSPIAYVVIGLFIFMTAIFFMGNLSYQVADFNKVLSTVGFTFIFIAPVLTMKIMAEERKGGTEVLLVTSPVSLTGIVIGKYLAAMFVFFVMTVVSFIFPIILFIFGKPEVPQLLGGYLGFLLLGGCCLAIGLFMSSLSENQVVAAVAGFVSLLTMWLIDAIANMIGGNIGMVLGWFALPTRYTDFNSGILNLSSIVYYLTFIAVFLFLTIRVIDKRRWSQG